MSMRNLYLFVTALGALAACGRTYVYHQDREVVVMGELEKVTHPTWGKVVDVVWGSLSIEGAGRPIKSADLDCFALRIGDSVSDKTYLASIASVHTQDYPARDGKVAVSVYWIMKDFASGTNADLARAQLVLLPKPSAACFEFETI